MLQPRDGVQHGKLHLLRQARGQALQVQLVRPEAARLQKELVARLVGKADDLRFDARAVARADAGDGAVEQRAAVQIFADDGVRALVRPRQPAHGLIFRRLTGGKRERLRIVVPALDLHFREIDAARVDARGRSGLEPAHPQAEGAQALAQLRRGAQAVRPGVQDALPGDDGAVEVRPGSDDDGAHAVFRAELRHNAADVPVLRPDLRDGSLLEIEVRLTLEQALHVLLIAAAVCLRAQGVHGRALAAVEHAVLDAAGVRRAAHLAAEGVELADEMALARAADGRVAGHVAHGVQIDREHDGLQPQPRGCEAGFDPGMARADDGNVIISCKIAHLRSSFFQITAVTA